MIYRIYRITKKGRLKIPYKSFPVFQNEKDAEVAILDALKNSVTVCEYTILPIITNGREYDLSDVMNIIQNDIREGKLTNLAFNKLDTYIKLLGYSLTQQEVRLIRNQLCEKGIAKFNAKKELIIVKSN